MADNHASQQMVALAHHNTLDQMARYIKKAEPVLYECNDFVTIHAEFLDLVRKT